MKDKIEQQKLHFNSIAEEYFYARNGRKQEVLDDLIYAELFKGVDYAGTDICVLEPMCGYGVGQTIIKKFFKEKNIEYVGFDYSEVIVEMAKKYNPDVNIYVQDVTTFTTDRLYDIVIIIGGLHHVPSACDEVVKRINNSLKQGGFFINVEPTYNNWLFKKVCEWIYKKNPIFDEETEKRFSLKALNELYTKSGFKILKQIYPGLLAYLLWFNPDVFPFLNKGSEKLVKRVFSFDRLWMYTIVGKKLSVATFSVLEKVDE